MGRTLNFNVPRFSRPALPALFLALMIGCASGPVQEKDYASRRGLKPEADPLLALRGSGRELLAAEPADQYVRRLREGWE